MSELVTHRPIERHRGTEHEQLDDVLVIEEPLEIRLGGVAIAVVMRTPGNDSELVQGFALTEGIALSGSELTEALDLGEGRFEIGLQPGIIVDPERFRRNLYATSSCGVCGKASIDAVRVAAQRAPDGPIVSRATLVALPDQLGAHQPAFDLTGGLHAAAAFSVDGTLVAAREDVGRHNAVDKLVGHLAGDAWPVATPILLVSGRVSFEIIQKAAVAGFRIVAGISAVSSLAVDLAEELGMTLLGFLRPDGFNTYTRPDRIS
jgi:FdhD protein